MAAAVAEGTRKGAASYTLAAGGHWTDNHGSAAPRSFEQFFLLLLVLLVLLVLLLFSPRHVYVN
jgi:hypothetical protein